MFNKDFYPTPEHVLDTMGIDCFNKVVLEPSAGSGNIIDYLKSNGAKDVLACEINENLSEIVKSKAKYLCPNFLKVTAEQISHINMIVMNPPFSKGDEHLIHAWEIAPDGCEIISLINYATLENDYSRGRHILKSIINNHGTSTNLSSVFSNSERPTEVEIGLVKLYKPSSGSNEFEGFFMDEDPEERQENALMPYNLIRDIVQRYISSVKKFEEIMKLSNELQSLSEMFSTGTIKCEIGYNDSVTDKESYKKALQKNAWGYLFKEMKMDKYVTSGVMKDINKFVEQQTKIPFTMKNIYKMFEIIVGTREQTFNRSLEEAVDRFTMHTHENRFSVEGWKTNSGHLLNKKFIIERVFEAGFGGKGKLSSIYSGNVDRFMDLIKVICSLTGTNYDTIGTLQYDKVTKERLWFEPNKWYEFGFFEIKGFYKGTMHVKFKEEKVWADVNRAYAKIKGQVLPEKFKSK